MSLTNGQNKRMINEFETLLRGTNRDGVEELIAWLHESGFFKAPARCEHGCAYPGGLLEHSLDVYHVLKDKLAPGANPVWNTMMESPAITDETIVIVGLLHDLCKVGLFNKTQVNRKNYDPEAVARQPEHTVKKDKDGQYFWETVKGYRRDETMPLGSGGEKSVILAQRFIRLTDDEMYALRWHRGFDGDECGYMVSSAIAAHPLILALYEADLEATYIIEQDKK